MKIAFLISLLKHKFEVCFSISENNLILSEIVPDIINITLTYIY